MNKPKLILLFLIVIVINIGAAVFLYHSGSSFDFLRATNSSTIELTVEPNSWQFTPEEVILKKGLKYTFKIDNKDSYAHGYTVEELEISEYLPPLSVTTFEFTPKVAGKFTSYCSVTCGRGHFSMKGKVIIID